NLNATSEIAWEAIRIINEVGAERDDQGRYSLLPGVNLLLGLNGESEASLEMNYLALKGMLMENLLIRRINIRHVVPFPGTRLYLEAGTRFVQKNRRFYAKWIERIRQEVDVPMLEKLYPIGVVLRDLYSEVHEGGVTFMRQPGSYPIVVGVRERLELGQRFSARITGHNPRSLTGEVLR
ncbi:MAG: radical SAM protein, partial [Phycisphaerae bacterium]|nr:radical SAM protein [Phycisphaerae bacterium]